MPSAGNAIVVEVDPRSAFAPLKNASGAAADTPESVKAKMSDFASAVAAGGRSSEVAGGSGGNQPLVRIGRRGSPQQDVAGLEDHQADLS